MRFLIHLISKLFGSEKTKREPIAPKHAASSRIEVTISYANREMPTVTVSESEVAEALKRYEFVLTNELDPLKSADRWFEQAAQKRRLRDGSEKAYEWLLPFMPLEIAKHDQIRPLLEYGPRSAERIVKTLRKLIRECRKTKQPWDHLIGTLYNSCVLDDFVRYLSFEGMPGHSMARYVDIHELSSASIEYLSIGYHSIDAISKTDVKWLVEAFGEPAEHQSFDALWPNIRRNAVSRYCWEELQSANETASAIGRPRRTMEDWLLELVTRNIGYHKEWLERRVVYEAQAKAAEADIQAAWTAMRVPFAVADLETTGLRSDSAEIVELAAVLVDPDGSVTSEFSVFVKTQQRIPKEITQLTGITQAEIDSKGRPLVDALSAFLAHLGDRPCFFHNAPFDHSFLRTACTQTKLKFENSVHDTLPIARRVWPSLGTYKLSALARHIEVAAPTHRALGDARVTLAVLLAAHEKAKE